MNQEQIPASPLFECRGVHYAYQGRFPALCGIDMTISRGQRIAFLGANGCGKSTLLNLLDGLVFPDKGSVAFTGKELTETMFADQGFSSGFRRSVGLVFQNPDDQLFSPTVYEDVAFGPLYQGRGQAEVAERVSSALSAVSMQSYARRVSHHLSVGEKKRIAIATVLSMNPEILVLDEPTSGLDPRARRSLIHLLRELPMTMLVSSHDLAMVRELLPRMVIMDEGHIVADGQTDQLMMDEALLEAHGLEKP